MSGHTLRMVLVGKTGVGKSASGNTILKRKAFKSTSLSSFLISECQKETGEFEYQPLAVVDTPGLFDTRKDQEVIKEIAKCISLAAPGPHVFLVVIQPGRFTEEERKTLKIIQQIFGEKAADYTMVLFSHGDNLVADGDSAEKFIHICQDLRDFIKQCDGGYHVFNNRSDDPTQIKELLKKINLMVQRNGGSFYTNELFIEAEKAIREKMKKIETENPKMRHEQVRKEAESNNEWLVDAGVGAAAGDPLGPAGVAIQRVIGAGFGGPVAALNAEEGLCVIM